MKRENREQLDETIKAFLEVAVEIITEDNVDERKFTSFDDVYEKTGIRKPVIVKLMQNDIAFHARLSGITKDANRQVVRLKGYKYELLKDFYSKDELPEKYLNNERFMKFVELWNKGERNRSEMSRQCDVHRDTIYEWLNVLCQV